MKLSQFIVTNTEQILADFELFARGIAEPGAMDIKALRDHASGMLKVIARDLETPQTEGEGSKKAKGESDAGELTPATPAQEHGSGRAASGFTVVQMVSEYRALRASVTRLWIETTGQLAAADVVDLIRFNESIDQALAESTHRFMGELERTRDTFLGILGHDLRSPMGAIITSAQFMLEETELTPAAHKLAVTMMNSGKRMNEMVSDLLDFTRGRLGVAIPIVPDHADLAEVVDAAVAEMKAARPSFNVVVDTVGDVSGEWDDARLRQVLSNLLSNALNHGGAAGPIRVTLRGNPDDVQITIHNDGPPIPAEQIPHIFDPLTRGPTASTDPQHLGLGLYIASQIVNGHGGTIAVDSSAERGTEFTIRLPRRVKRP